jgi:hypothetical protein
MEFLSGSASNLMGGKAEVKMTHIYIWDNNEKRKTLKDRPCRILKAMRINSLLVEFDDGQQEVVSRRALRKIR